MATLIFTAIGTAIGGPLGGAIGALIGRQVDGAIIGSPSREGPRLKELSVSTSTYGMPLPRHFGRMRVAGSIIWATDLVENRTTSGGGKGRPSVTTFSYSASFAVALASRRVRQLGRIWADGNLLRGAAGDLKVPGQLRFYDGSGDQPRDPLLSAAEGIDLNPAYRGLSYVVFQDLQLADFGNRIPALTFEVLCDEQPLNLAEILAEVIDQTEADYTLPLISGLSVEGPLADTLGQLAPVFPLNCDVSGTTLTLGPSATAPSTLRDPTVTTADDGFGGQSGFAHRRSPPRESPPEVIRYYDIARDYQPGMQRALGRPAPGQPASLELPVATHAAQARQMIEAAAQRANWARQEIAWRTSEIDPAVRPGSLVRVPRQTGIWRVEEWEWRSSGVELTISRLPPADGGLADTPQTDPGRPLTPPDVPVGTTELVAFELPWDGAGTGDAPLLFAATSSHSAGWAGAALYADEGDGQLLPLTMTGRNRAILGKAQDTLPPATPHLFDREGRVTIQLADSSAGLTDATPGQMAMGANRALLGEELFQFARAVPLGDGCWQLEGLLRGRGGTEAAVSGHAPDEAFVLLDGTATALDGMVAGRSAASMIAAIGVGDASPVRSAIHGYGATRRPLSPVHPRIGRLPDGGLALAWTRRARGAWTWRDGVDTPLHEETEAYDIVVGSQQILVRTITAPRHDMSIGELTGLRSMYPGQPLMVRQRGSYAVSHPLLLTHLN